MRSDRRLWIAPILISSLLVTLTILIFSSFKFHGQENLQEKSQVEATRVLSAITTDLYDRIMGLERMARRWETRGGTPRKEFELAAAHHVRDYPGFQAIEWVDSSNHVRWVIPESGNEAILGMQLEFDNNTQSTTEESLTIKKATLSPPFKLLGNNGQSIQFYVPLIANKKQDGMIVGVINLDHWITHLLSKKETKLEQSQFTASLFIDNKKVFREKNDIPDIKHIIATETTTVFGHEFKISVSPSIIMSDKTNKIITSLILVMGIIVSLMVGLIVYLFERTAIQTKKAIAAGNNLKETTETLTIATRAGGIGIWSWELKTNRLTWNDMMFDIYGVDTSISPLYQTWENAVHPDDLKKTIKLLNDAIRGRGIFETQFRIIRPNGEIRYIQAAANIEHDQHGIARIVRGTNFDVTAQELAEQQLAQEKQKLNYIIAGTDIGTWEWNIPAGEAIYNERWAEMIGYTLDELQPVTIETWRVLCHPDDFETSARLLEKHFNHETEYYDCEVRMKHKNGSWVWVHDRGKVATWTSDGEPLMMYGTHQEITERKRNEEEIYYQANYDTLTGLPTRNFIEDQLSLMLASANRNQKRVALLFVDLDGFKFVNDNFGHDAGDLLLKEVAKRLSSCIRKSDLVARIGGDEFLVIAGNLTNKENVGQIAKMIIDKVATPVEIYDGTVNISASVGIAFYPDDGTNADQLIKLADKAMYEIKHTGKNNFGFISDFLKPKIPV